MQQQKRPLMRKQPSRPIVIAAAPSPVHDDADDLQEVETDLLDDYTSSGFEAGHGEPTWAVLASDLSEKNPRARRFRHVRVA